MVDLHSFRKLSPGSLWVLGLLAADGCVSSRGIITLAQTGDAGLDRINRAAGLLGNPPVWHTTPKVGKVIHGVAFTDREFAAFLLTFGIGPRKSLTLQCSVSLVDEDHPAFLAGYIDGDGCVNIYNSGTTDYLLVSFVGTDAFTERAFGIIPAKGSRRRLTRARNCWEVRYTGWQAVAAGDFIWGSHAEGFKRLPYVDFKQNYSTKRTRYAPLRSKASRLLADGLSPMKVAAALGIPFQTIYKWRAALVVD